MSDHFIAKWIVSATMCVLLMPWAGAAETRHASGLAIVPEQSLDNVSPVPEALNQALFIAMKQSEQDAGHMAYPWIDRASGRVVVSTVSDKGVNAARALIRDNSPETGHAPLRWQTMAMRFSRAQLEHIKDEVIELQSTELPNADLITSTGPDPQHDRIIITVRSLDDSLLYALARRYGTEAIAVQVDPLPMQPLLGRQRDGAPYLGGATIAIYQNGRSFGLCTSGIPWNLGGGLTGMVTAGHCIPPDGARAVYTFNYPARRTVDLLGFGITTNWRKGIGTVLLPYQSRYRGDMALIQSSRYKPTAGLIYVGNANSTLRRRIGDRWGRPALPGDRFCTGGAFSGELCGWSVTGVQKNYKYATLNSIFNVARNVVEGQRPQATLYEGDSGAPVYTVWGDGRVSMKGVLSGGRNGFVTKVIFTDIWEVYFGLPGDVKLP